MVSPIRLTFCEGVVGSQDQTTEFLCRLLCEKATFSFFFSSASASLSSCNVVFTFLSHNTIVQTEINKVTCNRLASWKRIILRR